VTEGNIVDEFRIVLHAVRCSGQPALARVTKARVWLDQTSQLTGTASLTAPLGTVPNGTTDMQWWT
jgi:hypothetical protein